MTLLSDTIHVLRVDDEPDFADLAETVLEREHEQFAVETATSASEGLNYVADNHVDCVISDYEMPGQDGIEFLEAIREEHPGLPFILFTGKGSEAVASDAISAGVTDYLQKESSTSQYAVLANRVRNAVEAFTAQRERQRNLEAIESAQEGIAILQDEHFSYVNQQYADLYGYEPEEMIGEHWELVYPDEDVQRGHEEVLPAVKEQGHWQEKTRGVRADGTTFVKTHTLSLTDSGDLVCTVRDVTEREQRQRRLEETMARLELAVEGANLGVWDWDMQTDEVQFNEKWAEILGYTLDEIDASLDALAHRVHPDNIDDATETLQAHIDGETEYYDSEHRLRTADDDWKWIRDIGQVVERDDAGEPVRAVGIHLDIDERKQREKELQQEKQRLEEFTSVVSHDLRNPLKVASGRIELARDDCDSPHLEDADAALTRMGELLEDLLALARSGDQIDEVVPVAIPDLTENCWRNVKTDDATVVAATDRTIRADGGRVRQLFENLFRNAVEHGGPDVTVTVGELENGFYIEDNGNGVPEPHREEVFETGYSTSEDGTGFGLSIVQQVANAHGWSIRVTESADGGARFESTGVEFDD